MEIEKALIHSNYIEGNTTLGFDIALLRLKENVAFSRFVKTICLPTEDYNELNTSTAVNMTIMGFGNTENTTGSTVLMKTNVGFIPFETCNERYKSIENVKRLHKGQMCTGGKVKDACKGKKGNVHDLPFGKNISQTGDSGGPLVDLSENSNGIHRYFQYGIVSFGISCGIAPAVYTDVRYFIDWISTNVEP